MSFIELPHTADIKIRVTAQSCNTLFAEAAMALMEVLFGKDRNGGIERSVDLGDADPESLMNDFLSELLFITEVDNLVFATAEVNVRDGHLHAVLSGEPFDPERHNEGTEVKGISYSDMKIVHDTNGYMLDIIFDV
jgi:SHS2 domain-containing protein